jgi:hypothetical protein
MFTASTKEAKEFLSFDNPAPADGYRIYRGFCLSLFWLCRLYFFNTIAHNIFASV